MSCGDRGFPLHHEVRRVTCEHIFCSALLQRIFRERFSPHRELPQNKESAISYHLLISEPRGIQECGLSLYQDHSDLHQEFSLHALNQIYPWCKFPREAPATLRGNSK